MGFPLFGLDISLVFPWQDELVSGVLKFTLLMAVGSGPAGSYMMALLI